MRYFNTETEETYMTDEEMYDRVYEETDDLNLIFDFMDKNFSMYEIWDMLKDDEKCKIFDSVVQNYIDNNIEEMEED